ncbi:MULTISPECIES: protein-disulfide reductase DsbD [Alphaproteobacteria]|uniref:Thiol:disulfide interchange protein DsbD n=2 Tax=Alphaproteobacteria TaxID=28211 RepID=A0A512HLF3_9HYPH|nr:MULTISPECIES: protein-disulfide reductase DsbD [Alphaproteobacteria]GEO86274.1 thiol:disulfide interchange protein DsbD [Ciceribacter naphthalenivorans]GLR21348.1 thiol:disulfide interchange protein DsbD [Ciceribacter naphthalenivorans]GLT04204.1 thiol:disulfide interchange protein DsbD [Sphingomonas psychrolutea]
MHYSKLFIGLLFSAFFASPAAALERPLDMDKAFVFSVKRSEAGRVSLNWDIGKGYYLYREYLAATTPEGKPVALETGPGTLKDDPGLGKVEVYFDHAVALTSTDAPALEVTYQGCQEEGICYPPTTRRIDLVALAKERGSKWMPAGTTGSAGSTPVSGDTPAVPVETGSAGSSTGFAIATPPSGGMVEGFLARGGMPLLLTAFLGLGILLAFTPCVFPMYPILAATLAREGERLTARRGLMLSLTYGLGLATAFGMLGLLAAWSGQNLQFALQSPVTIALTAMLFVVLALASFGLFELQLPAVITGWFMRKRLSGPGSIGSAAVLGFSSALIIGPCVTAPLAGALLYIARSGDLVLGAAALFALGLGKSVPLVVMATFGSGLLPRAGAWMERIRQLFGFLFIATAIWLAEPLLPTAGILGLWSALLVTFGVFIGAFDSLRPETGALPRLGKSVGLLSALYGAVLAVGLAAGATDPLAPLASFSASRAVLSPAGLLKTDFASVASAHELEALLAAGAKGNRPALVYVTADWCISCRTIERNVLSRPEVAQALAGFDRLSVDLTTSNTDLAGLMKSLDVVGPPTMLFFDGPAEVAETRLVGEVDKADLVLSAGQAKAALQ